MKIRHLLFIFSAALAIGIIDYPQNANAAKYSKSEARSVKQFQATYHQLDQTNYDQSNLYLKKPNFAAPFSSGVLEPAYIKTSIAYINYYRSLFGLAPEANFDSINHDAQLGAAALASVNAKTSLQAHGLLGYKRPNYISKADWEKAENATLGNVNFLESTSGASAGEIVTDLLQDQNNLAGSGNTGHRALLLSARASRIGIGGAYGKNNGKFYSVENGIFADDILRPASKKIVSYPSNTVFPLELLGKDTPWSIYFANRHISRLPKITITDLTTKKSYSARHVRNYGSDYFGQGYTAALSFTPPRRMRLVNTHKYQIKIGNIYRYSFRLFRQQN